MTVTKDTPHLRLFKLKIDEAVNYVPKMHASEKLKAVQFWNVVSEKLQVIVNSCAADINAVSVKTQENESEKIHTNRSLEVNNSRPIDANPNSSISSDFIHLSSTYGMNSGIGEQYHSIDIDNTQLLTSDATFSIRKETSVINNHAANVPFIHHLNSSVNSCEKTIPDNYIVLDSISQCSCDTLGIDSCISSDSRTYESNKTNDYSSKEIPHQESPQVSQLSEGTKEISSALCQSNSLPLDSSNEFLMQNQKSCRTHKRKKDKNYSILRNSLVNKKLKCESNCDNISDVNENSVDSVKSDFNSEESDSNHVEPIVSFVVSSSEEILAKNGLTPELVESGDSKRHKSYSCTDCPARFSTKGNLSVHMRRHTGEKPYPCAKCTSRFTTKGNLKRHMKTHTGEKPYECTKCGGKFTEKKSLIVHMRRHTGEKPYECKECGKRFAQSGILQTHMAMHLNQKFHLCEHCGKSFRQRSQLQTHKLRHTNVRKYGCSSCSSRFLTKGDLERHMRTHTGERPYVCKVCSKAYTRQQSLNEHLNRHYGIRPYSCKFCSRAFTEMSACYKHIKQHKKADGNGPKLLSTESSDEPPKARHVDSNGAEVPSHHPEGDENMVTHQSLASFIENFFH